MEATKPTWTTLEALDRNDVFDSGLKTTKYCVLGKIGKQDDKTSATHTEIARMSPVHGVAPAPYLLNSDAKVRYIGTKDQLLRG
jgi:hypothetical protein